MKQGRAPAFWQLRDGGMGEAEARAVCGFDYAGGAVDLAVGIPRHATVGVALVACAWAGEERFSQAALSARELVLLRSEGFGQLEVASPKTTRTSPTGDDRSTSSGRLVSVHGVWTLTRQPGRARFAKPST